LKKFLDERKQIFEWINFKDLFHVYE
jgi:hypothetical protein